MKGKERCKILKDIRREIAANNDIEFVTSECKHKGDCLGTCPKCEEELRYLERELEKRQRLGKTVALAGLTATITLSAAGCDICDILGTTAGDLRPDESYEMTDVAGGITKESKGELIVEPFVGEIASVPSIDVITAENAESLLGMYSRADIQAVWSDFEANMIEPVEGQGNSFDAYLSKNDTLIILYYDEADVLLSVEVEYEYHNE